MAASQDELAALKQNWPVKPEDYFAAQPDPKKRTLKDYCSDCHGWGNGGCDACIPWTCGC
jgi:hypothetical protein